MPPEFPDPVAFRNELESIPQHLSVADASYRDDRVKCVFAIAPVLGGAFSAEGLASIKIPVKMVVGEADQMAPAAPNASYFARYIRGAQLSILKNVGHYTFLAEATEAGKRELPLFCLASPEVNRASTHRIVGNLAKEFFQRHLNAP
jgi:predicted dienelactone hydrolase